MSEEPSGSNLFENLAELEWEKKVLKLLAKDEDPQIIIDKLLGRKQND